MPPTHHELVMELFASRIQLLCDISGSHITTVCCTPLSLVCFDCHIRFPKTNALSWLEEHLSVDCYTQLCWEPWSSRHPTSLVLGSDVGWHNSSNSQGKRVRRIIRTLSLILVSLSCHLHSTLHGINQLLWVFFLILRLSFLELTTQFNPAPLPCKDVSMWLQLFFRTRGLHVHDQSVYVYTGHDVSVSNTHKY